MEYGVQVSVLILIVFFIFHQFRKLQSQINDLKWTVISQGETITRQGETITRQGETITRQGERITRQEEKLSNVLKVILKLTGFCRRLDRAIRNPPDGF